MKPLQYRSVFCFNVTYVNKIDYICISVISNKIHLLDEHKLLSIM